LAHCSTVRIKNAKFHVSESGRLKTVEQKRKRVHAYVRGELVAYNEEIPKTFVKVLYNPYHTSLFMNSNTNEPIYEADEVMCSGKFAYATVSERLF
jgi:glycine cleavage system H lipoate-binding protein